MQSSIAKKPETRTATKNIMLRCDPRLNKALRQAALDRDTSMQAICIEALEAYVGFTPEHEEGGAAA